MMHDSPQPKVHSGNRLYQFIGLRNAIGSHLRPWLIHRPVQWLLDAICAAAAIFFAYSLRFNFAIPPYEWRYIHVWVPVLFVVTPIVFSVMGEYRATWQFFGHRDMFRLTWSTLPINAVMILLRALTPAHKHGPIPYSVAVMDFGIVLALTGSLRMLRRLDHELVLRQAQTKRVLIVGTPLTLLGAVRQLQPHYGSGVAGIVADDDALRDMSVAGVPVLGPCRDLRQILTAYQIDLIFLCSADFPATADIIELASEMDVPVKLLPSPQDLVDNRVRVSKTVTVDSLRSRNDAEAQSLSPVVVRCLEGRTILVTGAGGSIGSEIARQVAAQEFKKLIVLDNNENSIFELLNELGRRPNLMPVIADIRDRDAIRNLFDKERPDVILHAAAYKHVPMMELNPCESVLNNVYGTGVLVDAAVEFYAERLVMISSDKAVKPSSVMGATKRVAEMVVQQKASLLVDDPKPRTHFACVRFGNVLGSRGSVLPIFLRQIANGGPVTVTHEDMTRYFMTIPQAVRLVLHAASLASSGDVYMLDMGDPVRIMDFAREVIALSGLTPGKDIEIEVVGTRPGEKLHEQLWCEDAHVVPTEFTHVLRVRAPGVDPSFPAILGTLIGAARERKSDEVLALLHSLPIQFLAEPSDPVAAVLRRR